MEKINFLGIVVDNLPKDHLLKRIRSSLSDSARLRIEGLNVFKFMQTIDDSSLRDALGNAEIIHVDGVGIKLGLKILGLDGCESYPGIDLMHDILSTSESQPFKVFLLGATQEIVTKAKAEFQYMYPNLKICGFHNGYFGIEEEQGIVSLINSSDPDLLLLGMSSPKKEIFIERNWGCLNASVSLGVGGAFDVVAGKVRRAPMCMRRLGLEWLFRFSQEPIRLFRRYTIYNIRFLAILIKFRLGKAVR
jgi:N-acetylglucosaminyldiphosphoundecaprenol N-acetyl-beta-D-mannosaminyltransferase